MRSAAPLRARFCAPAVAHSRGQLLLYANGNVYPFDLGTKTIGAALAEMPAGASFSGAGAAAFAAP